MNLLTYESIVSKLREKNVTLIAVSKTKSVDDILALYNVGQRDFGENYVQELIEKYEQLPKDIRWHFIGHLQSNKVKYIAPFVYLIHSIDSLKLLQEVEKQASKHNKKINCLLQAYIAKEETKFGLDFDEIKNIFKSIVDDKFKSIEITGLMGMASNTEDNLLIMNEYKSLKNLYDTLNIEFPKHYLSTLSMGMSADYGLAIEQGSNMVRIGSLLFGARKK